MSDESKMIAQAQADYLSHRASYNNPYESGSPDFNAYERGWMQSLKRDDSKPMEPYTPQSDSWHRIEPVAPPVNLYALHKGRDSPRKPK